MIMKDLMCSAAVSVTKAPASWIAAVVLVLVGCLGGGIDTVSSDGGSISYVLVGRVERPDGTPDSGAMVSLYPSGYDPAGYKGYVVQRVVADSLGRFMFSDLALARYAVTARSGDGALWRMADSLRSHLTGRIDTLRLAMPRRLVVDLTAADSVTGVRFPAVLSVRGTDILMSFDGTNTPFIDTLPVGAESVIVRFAMQSPITLKIPEPAHQSDPGHGGPRSDTLRVKATPSGPIIVR